MIAMRPDVIATIPALLRQRCPPTVPGCIRAIIVDAVKGESFGAPSHVSQKRCVVITPFRAHRDPSAAVILETLVPRIEAPLFRSSPRSIFARRFLSTRVTVTQMWWGKETPVALSTSTTASISLLQVCSSDDRARAAVTETVPNSWALGSDGIACERDNRQVSKALSG